MSDNQFPQQHDEQGQADGERLIYSASDLALNQAALLREAADGEMIRAAVAQGWCIPPNTSKAMDVELGQAIVNNVIEAILALPTDQTALDRHDGELLAREAEARSRVLQANENLRAEVATLKTETAAMLEKAVAAVDNCLKHIDYSRERKQGDGTTVTPLIVLLTVDVAEVLAALRALIPTDYAAALAERDAKQYAIGFEAAHELRSCGHSRGDFRDKNFPESEIGYLKGGPLLNYSCVGCDSVAEGVQSAYELGISDGIESVARSRTSKVARLVRLKDLRKRLAARLAAARAPEETK